MQKNLIFFFTQAAAGMAILFIPNLAAELNANEYMIGFIVSVYGLMSFVSMYIFGWMSDRFGRESLIKYGILFSAFTFALQAFADTTTSLLIVRALCGLSIGVFYSSLIIYGIESGKKIGKFTAYESLGWGTGSLLAGFIAVYSHIFMVSAFFFLISFALAIKLPTKMGGRIKVPLIPIKLIAKNKRIYIPFLFRDIGAFCIWTFLPLYLGDVLGASKSWIGVIYFLNTGSQFVFKQYVDKYRYGKLFKVGMLSSALAFLGYGLAPSFYYIMPVSVLVGLAWSTLSVGAMGSLTEKNIEKASAIGLFSSSRCLAQIVAPLIAAFLTSWGGYNLLFGFSAGITMVGLGINLILRKH